MLVCWDVGGRYMIIDGFYCLFFVKMDKEVLVFLDGKVLCCVFEFDWVDCMVLIVCINWVKGFYVVLKMYELVSELYIEYGWDLKWVVNEIGVIIYEVEMFFLENVFKKYDLENYKYNKVWVFISV